MERPDSEYRRLVDNIDGLISGQRKPSLLLGVQITGDASISVAYICHVAQFDKTDAILFGGIRERIFDILKELALDRLKDPAILDWIGLQLKARLQ